MSHAPIPASILRAGVALAILSACLAARPAEAATLPVANCNDSGPGSLRSVVSTAPDGAVVDLRALACNRVLLTTGEITVAQDNLQLLGRGRRFLLLDGNLQGRILNHTGDGTLRITRLSIANGVDRRQFAKGGCVQSDATVWLESSTVRNCRSEAVRNPDDECELGCPMGASGGAVHGREVRMSRSTVADSRASAFDGQGGGVFAVARVTMFGSRLTNNLATNGTGAFAGREFVAHDSLLDHNGLDFNETFAEQGAVYVFDGPAVLVRSAVVDNVALGCAAVCVAGRGAIVDSTVARNQGATILRFDEEGLVANSTVAVNRDGVGPVTNPVRCSGAITTPRLVLDSSIVALNTCGSNYALDIVAGTISGSHNLVQFSRARLPADTLRVNPKLQTLRANGGSTPTMALLEGSAAVDAGSNPLDLAYDQRAGGFQRTAGAAPDIGAFEIQSP